MTQPRQRKARPARPDTAGGSAAATTTTAATATAAALQATGAAASAAPAPSSDLAPNPAAIPKPASSLVSSSDTKSSSRQLRPTKIARLQQMLQAPEGASLAQLCAALGWQAHTLRAALTRLRQAGHAVEHSRSVEGATVYRIVGDTVGVASSAGVPAESSHTLFAESGKLEEASSRGTESGASAHGAAPASEDAPSSDAGART